MLRRKLKWFKYLSNQACNTHWGKATEPLRQSAYLGLEISKDQLELLNPSIGDLMLSKMEEDTIGAKAKKKIARRRHDFIDGSAKSYAKILNCPTRMRRLEDYNKMQACLAEVLAGRGEEKKQRKLEREQEKANKEKKSREGSSIGSRKEGEDRWDCGRHSERPESFPNIEDESSERNPSSLLLCATCRYV